MMNHHHLCSVSGVRRWRVRRSIARGVIAAQLFTVLQPVAIAAAGQAPPLGSIASMSPVAAIAAAATARAADAKLAELQLPPGALIGDGDGGSGLPAARAADAMLAELQLPFGALIGDDIGNSSLPAAARAADVKLAELQLPFGALIGEAGGVPVPDTTPVAGTASAFGPISERLPAFGVGTVPTSDEAIEDLLADYLIGAEPRPGPRPDGRPTGPVGPATPPPAPKPVAVNRTVPRVTPRALAPTLSAEPVDREFFDARIFAEPLVPTGATTPDDNRALGQALRQYLDGRNRENVGMVLAHLQRFPASPWRASLFANVGTVFSQHGFYTRAFESWNSAWQSTKDSKEPRVRAIADYAIAQWLDLMMKFGDVNALEGKIKELEGRQLTGSTGANIKLAKDGLWVLKNHHDWATPSARVALASWLYSRSPAYAKSRARVERSAEEAAAVERTGASVALNASNREGAGSPTFQLPKALTEFHARPEGTNLRELATLAAASGLRVRTAYRPAGSPIVTPAIAHLKPGHYTFVLKQEETRVLVRDSILGGEIWFSRAAFEEESSGYWLINDGPLPKDWRTVENNEADVIIGRCIPGHWDSRDPCGCENNGGSGQGPTGQGMPVYFFHPVAASLRLADTPVGYVPPRGPAAHFTVTYNHRETMHPSTFVYSNLGPMWTYDWLSYVNEVPLICPPGNGNCLNPYVSVFLRRSGEEVFRNPNVNGVYPAYHKSRAVLVKVSESPIHYERRLPDGSLEVFTQSDGAPSGQRRIFLTSIVDPQGQALQISYDSQMRVVGFTDAVGQVTTASYEHPTDPLKITKVTDPFGRFATFTYNAAGQLASITDVIGLTSSFTYASDDFISAMTTPYGTTTFRQDNGTGYPKIVEATDPLGGTEHLEYHFQNTSVADSDPVGVVPTGFTAFNENLQWYTTFYWNKRQWALHPGDVTKATQTKWLLHDRNPDDQNHGVALSIPHSIKKPLETKVWYSYPGQGSKRWAGSWKMPDQIGRVLDDGSSQISEATYSALGQITSSTDPLGRRTSYVHADDGINLIEVRQTTGVMNELLAIYGTYTNQRMPQNQTDGAGRTTALTYNSAGQVLTFTNAKSETTIYSYASSGLLQTITRPAIGATTTFSYDSYGHIYTVSDSDGYIVTIEYDLADRVVRRTYPDGTYEQFVYDRLDLARRRDRRGRWTTISHDRLRRPVASRDAAGRVLSQTWCTCGSLESLTDAKGQRTRWEHDIQSRVVREVAADGVTSRIVTYETATSRVRAVTDPKLQVTTYSYNLDDAFASVVFTNTAIPTPSVSFSYDAAYGRQTSMVDGTGTTAYTYHPAGGLGAGRVASIDGPLTDDTITYVYDELGRVVTQAINSVGLTITYDTLGRMTSESNVLGSFAYGYDGRSNRLASILYPSGQTSTYAYFGNADDRRLQTIHHKKPNASTLSKHDYTYDSVGTVLTWQHQRDAATPEAWHYRYDDVDQLVSADKWLMGVVPTIVSRSGYVYDEAGNRTTEQIDDAVIRTSHDSLNRLAQQQPGGVLRFAGTVNEPAAVTIQGKAVNVDGLNRFSGAATVANGANTVSIQATDSSGNTINAQYSVGVSGPSRSFTVDANGNVTSDGTRSLEWDARNQLVAVTAGTQRTEFVYDGLRRRIRSIVSIGGVVQSDKRMVWCGETICEERAGNGTTVTRRMFEYGEQVTGTSHFYAADHLGSVRDITDGAGVVLATYDFDPWGRRTLVSGTDSSSAGFAAQRWDAANSLSLTQYRAYDPQLGRWLSPDPLGLFDGPNLFAYVSNRPVHSIDPTGLFAMILVIPAVKIGCLVVEGAAAVALGLLIAQTTSDVCADGKCKTPEKPDDKKGCKPCIPPVGTISYRHDTDPKSRPHRGVPPPHWHLYRMNQSPPPMCKCFWVEIPDGKGGFGPGSPPPGTSPIGPAQGGGAM
jgi:RHS repeat-associated protein